MVYKAVGSILLCACALFISLYVSRFEKRRLEVTDAYISLLFYIKGQVDCYSMPICEILSGAPPRVLDACSYVASDGLVSMVERSKPYLSDESFRLLFCFASEFGSTYREEQMKRCDYYIEALAKERENMAEDIPKRSRIYSTLAICSVLCIIILLW